MNHIGIDPGKSGGLALLTADGTLIDVVKMPAGDHDMLDLLEEWKGIGKVQAVLELVGPTPRDGVRQAFGMGSERARCRMALAATKVPFREVSPAKWQKDYRLPTRKAVGETAKKNAHKSRARELFPAVKVTHALADALLIAEFGRRTA